MSNYSDFFGVGSSGGGGSVPINSYLPFSVGSTGNPPGYDAATGLYTHPDGTFWLSSGATIADTANNYPNATATFTISNQGAPYGPNVTNFGSSFGNGDNYVCINGGNVQEYDHNGNLVTDFGAQPGGSSGFVCKSTTNIYIGADEFDLTLTATGNTFAGFAASYSQFLIDANTLGTITAGPNHHREYSLTTYAQTRAWGDPTGTWQAGGGYRDGEVMGTNNFTPTQVFRVNNITQASSGTYTVNWTGNTRRIIVTENFIFVRDAVDRVVSIPFTANVGDPTGRTDTDTSQPLFIRLK